MNRTEDILTFMKKFLHKIREILRYTGKQIKIIPIRVRHYCRKVGLSKVVFNTKKVHEKQFDEQKSGNVQKKGSFVRGIGAGILTGILAAAAISAAIFHSYAEDAADREAELKSEIAELESEKKSLEDKNAILQIEGDKSEIARKNAEILASDEAGWSLVLVNEEHPLATDYEPPHLVAIDSERSVDSRIAADLQQMMSDGAAQGLDMYVTSAYRSYERQREVFSAGMQERLNSGLAPLEAYEDTSTSIAFPGTSEHATGLAVDIIANGYSELDEKQASTPEQQWLMAHCWEYGFILRYPQDTGDITGIIYEPWHYRYVGKEAAKEITEQGITLEEYLGE